MEPLGEIKLPDYRSQTAVGLAVQDVNPPLPDRSDVGELRPGEDLVPHRRKPSRKIYYRSSKNRLSDGDDGIRGPLGPPGPGGGVEVVPREERSGHPLHPGRSGGERQE